MRKTEDWLGLKMQRWRMGGMWKGRGGDDSVVAWNVGTECRDENAPAERASAVCLPSV